MKKMIFGNKSSIHTFIFFVKNIWITKLQNITIAPFKHNEEESIIDNQNISYNEILKIGQVLNKDLVGKIWSWKKFADIIATKQICIPNAGHINSESGYDTFEEIVSYIWL